uniref:Uncharacterized protein n=1 Tax=Knipowitschia caucasica TaxID=637954 RepID=A0AAV2MET5_KNICA
MDHGAVLATFSPSSRTHMGGASASSQRLYPLSKPPVQPPVQPRLPPASTPQPHTQTDPEPLPTPPTAPATDLGG